MIKINIDVFRTKLYISENDKDIVKILKLNNSKETLEEVKEFYNGLYFRGNGNNKYIIIVTEKIHILTHELLHCVQDICRHRSIDDRECEAYLLDFLLEEALKKLKYIN